MSTSSAELYVYVLFLFDRSNEQELFDSFPQTAVHESDSTTVKDTGEKIANNNSGSGKCCLTTRIRMAFLSNIMIRC